MVTGKCWVQTVFEKKREKKWFQIFTKWRRVISWTLECLILVRTRKIYFFLQKNLTYVYVYLIWHINIPISAGKRRPISWSASTLHSSLSFIIQLCWLSLFSSPQNSSGNWREDRARTGSKSRTSAITSHVPLAKTPPRLWRIIS